jgi:hypothetical protein
MERYTVHYFGRSRWYVLGANNDYSNTDRTIAVCSHESDAVRIAALLNEAEGENT